MIKLGDKIKQLRLEKGIRQDDLAAAAGITKSSISNYERNQRSPQYDVLYKISEALDVPLAELLTGTTAEKENMEVAKENQTDSKRPRRVTKLMAAFEKLSDEAQRIAIERIEELALIPKYQMTLPQSLQRYINNKLLLAYEISEDTEEQEPYAGEDKEYLINVRHIILKRESGSCTSYWHLMYYQLEQAIDDSAAREIISQHESYGNRQDRFSFVLDNKEAYNQFFDRHCDLRADDDHLDELQGGDIERPEITFFLINKETWEINDMDSSANAI